MGVSRTGRLAVLVNFHERQPVGELSRGQLPVSFLTSNLPAKQWTADTLEEHAEALALAGGFMMMYGEVIPDKAGQIAPLQMLSNRQPPATLLGDDCPTLSMSNGPLSDKTWTKTDALTKAFAPLTKMHGDEFVDSCFRLLSTVSVTTELTLSNVRTTVFVPRCELPDGPYATRTQTVVLVDHSGKLTYLEKTLGAHAGNPDAVVEPSAEQFIIK